jgi:hypothetical protein
VLPRSHYRGVTWDAPSKAWRAAIKVKSKPWYLGLQELELDAAKAYDVACWFLTGSKTNLNFAEEDYELAQLPRRPPPWLEKHMLEQFEWDKSHIKHSTELFKRWRATVARRGLAAPAREGFVNRDGAFHSLGHSRPPAKQPRHGPKAARAVHAAAAATTGHRIEG